MARMNLESIIEESLQANAYKEPLNTTTKKPMSPQFKFSDYVLLSSFYSFLLVTSLLVTSTVYHTTRSPLYGSLGLAISFLMHVTGILHKEYFFASHLVHSPTHKVKGFLNYMFMQIILYSLAQGIILGLGAGIIYLLLVLEFPLYVKIPLIIVMILLTLIIHDMFVHNLITYAISFGTGFVTQFDKTSYNLSVLKQSLMKSLAWVFTLGFMSLLAVISFSYTMIPYFFWVALTLDLAFTSLVTYLDYKQRKALLVETPELVMDTLPQTLIPLVEKNLENLVSDIYRYNQDLLDSSLAPSALLDLDDTEYMESPGRQHVQKQSTARQSDPHQDSVFFDPKGKKVIKKHVKHQDFDNAFPQPALSSHKGLHCPVCGKWNEADYRFCYNCGSPLINSDTFRET